MAKTAKLFRCIIAPGLVEIRSDFKFMLGGMSLDFRSEQWLQQETACEICITSLLRNDACRRHPYDAIELANAYGGFKGNILQYRRSLLGLVKLHVELKGFDKNPIITVNRPYHKLARIRVGDWYPLSIYVQDILSTQLLMRGYGALHGAAFGVSGELVLVAGLPAVGKSTVLYQALKQGGQFLTEDMMIMDSAGFLHACPGVSSFSFEMGRIRELFRYDKLGFLRSWWMGFLSRVPFVFSLFNWPYVDIVSFFPQVEHLTCARPHSIFILARGDRRVRELSPTEALRMLVAINRHTFSYWENRLLLRYSLLNPWLNYAELRQTEEKLILKLVNGSRSFLCVAPRPDEYLSLIQQNI